MFKILLLAVVVWLVLTILKKYAKTSSSTPPPEPKAETMVKCAFCGVHLPKKESYMSEQQYFCSEAHISEYKAKSEHNPR